MPRVVIGGLPDEIPLSRVDVDDETTLYEAVLWLIGIGHRRIGIVTGPSTQWSAVRRERAYFKALAQAGIERDPALCYAGDYTAASGNIGASVLLKANPRPTAIVCGNDAVAIGAIEALHRLHVRVPEEISILGFDDHQIASWSRPPLTTVRQPLHEMGMKAAEILIDSLERQAVKTPSVVKFPGALVKRRSVASPPG
jgi:DNA-binding LacI/PurR family transcriptional regulator